MRQMTSGFRIRFICLILLVMAVVVVGCAPDAALPEQPETYTVVKIRDGDSIAVRANGVSVEVRLFGIDAPEFNQPYAKESRREAEQLLNGKQVIIEIIEKDRYDRAVAQVYLPGDKKSINSLLVERGAAWVYRRYTNDNQLISLEKQAKKQRIGLWAAPMAELVPPWEWRKKEKR